MKPIVLALAEMELIFPPTALTVLCFVLAATKVWRTQQSFPCCLSNIPHCHQEAAGVTQPRQGTQSDRRDIS